ncbi:MAG: transporter substrate-binding domain-containing protein, partial [Campylobacterales bacterium]|nr:transporter substrate-binding domain-containing protein [Campylobacterales bacterium]
QTLKKISGLDNNTFGHIEKERIRHIQAIYYLATHHNQEINFEEFIANFDYGKEEVSVCYSKDMKPYMYYEKGEERGLSLDYLKLIAQKSDLKFKFVLSPNFKEHLEMNRRGICDIAPAIVKEPNTYDFLIPTNHYTHDYLSLVTRIEEPYIADMEEIVGKKIAVNSSYENVLQILKNRYPNTSFYLTNRAKALESLNNGEIFGYIGLFVEVSYEIRNTYAGELKVMRTLDGSKVLGCIGVNKRKPHLVEKINTALDKITMQEENIINTQWRNIDVKKLIDYSLIYKFLAGGLIFFLIFLYRQYILKKLNKQLENEVEKKVEENRKKDRLIFQQSKLASMGEMINNIAHQWRHPLSEINSIVMNIDYKLIKNKTKDKELEVQLEKIENQTKYMSETIENFRNYFKPEKEKSEFLISTAVNNGVNILKDMFIKQGIEIDVDIIEDRLVLGYLGEFTQVLIILLNNSKDAFIEKEIKDKKIMLTIDGALFVEDCGGGIDEKIVDRIFDPYFTTKSPTQGTGIGLYMSKMIIE